MSASHLRPRTVAEMLGVSERTVRRWIAEGTLPSRRLGGTRLIARTDLEQRLGAPLNFTEASGDEAT